MVLPNIIKKEKFINYAENWDQEEFGRLKEGVYNLLEKNLGDKYQIEIKL